jgi:hypothetical protein
MGKREQSETNKTFYETQPRRKIMALKADTGLTLFFASIDLSSIKSFSSRVRD